MVPTVSLELPALKLTEVPVRVVLGDTENDEDGAASTVIEWLAVAVWPASLVVVNVIV
jgi:hypothetical protein